MAEADRIAAALAYQEQMPAMLNPNLARQGARGRANMMPPTSIMDERYPAWKRNQEDVEKLMLGVDLVGSAIPLAGPAMKGAKVLGQHAAPQLAQALENYAFKTGMALPMVERQAGRTFAAPQDEALRLAQERAALPVEQGGLGLPPNNTAEQRAAAMGGEDVYHGTTAKKQILNDLKFNLEKDQRQVGGIWTTKDKNYAIWLADKKNKDLANVMQLQLLNAKNSDEFDILKEAIKIADQINAPKPTNALEAQELLSGGYGWDRVVADLLNESKTPNLKITNFNDAYHSNPNEVTTAFVTKDPSLFRLPNAAFDPFRRNAATAAAMGVAAPDLLAKERNK